MAAACSQPWCSTRLGEMIIMEANVACGGAFNYRWRSSPEKQLSCATRKITFVKSRPHCGSQRRPNNSTYNEVYDCCKVINLSMPEMYAKSHPRTLKYHNKAKDCCRGSSSTPNMPFSAKRSGENVSGPTYSNNTHYL